MYVSYLLDRDTGMYSNSVREQTQTLNSQYVPMPSQYGDFTGYHQHVAGIGDLQTPGAWNPAYAAPREEWSSYGHSAGFPGHSPVTGQFGFSSPDLTCVPPSLPGGLPPLDSPAGQNSPSGSQRRSSYDWIRGNVHESNSGGKTRTKDKYRVVYSDHQRLELEKEFQYSRYITIRKKTELATTLSLSERQVKIWFQNRRAKERKLNKKKLQLSQHASSTPPTPPAPPAAPGNLGMENSPGNNGMENSPGNNGMLPEILSMTVKAEY